MRRLLLMLAVLGLFAFVVPDQAKADHRHRGGYSSFYGGYGWPHRGYGPPPGYFVPAPRPPAVYYGAPLPRHYPAYRPYSPVYGSPYGFQRGGVSLYFGF